MRGSRQYSCEPPLHRAEEQGEDGESVRERISVHVANGHGAQCTPPPKNKAVREQSNALLLHRGITFERLRPRASRSRTDI
jgi:hypothetical protein